MRKAPASDKVAFKRRQPCSEVTEVLHCRPYRKNVQYIILVRPSGFLRAVLAFMRPFVSRKAGRKIKQVGAIMVEHKGYMLIGLLSVVGG